MNKEISETNINNPKTNPFLIIKSEQEPSPVLEKISKQNEISIVNSKSKVVSNKKENVTYSKLSCQFSHFNKYSEKLLNKKNEIRILKIEINQLKSEKKIASNVILKLKEALRKASQEKEKFKKLLKNKANDSKKYKNKITQPNTKEKRKLRSEHSNISTKKAKNSEKNNDQSKFDESFDLNESDDDDNDENEQLKKTKSEKIEKEFRIEKKLRFDVWRRLENGRHGKLSKSKMKKSELFEVNFISKSFKDHLNKKFGLKTHDRCFSKTKNGYTFIRECNQKYCRAPHCLKINITDGTGIISYNDKCKKHKN